MLRWALLRWLNYCIWAVESVGLLSLKYLLRVFSNGPSLRTTIAAYRLPTQRCDITLWACWFVGIVHWPAVHYLCLGVLSHKQVYITIALSAFCVGLALFNDFHDSPQYLICKNYLVGQRVTYVFKTIVVIYLFSFYCGMVLPNLTCNIVDIIILICRYFCL